MQQTYLRFAGFIAVAATGALGVGCSNNSTGSGSETSRPASEATTGAGGRLGYPTADEDTIPGGWQSQFQHGTITYTDGQAKIEAR